MAKISEMDGRKDGAYTRLLGDPNLGHLASQTHAAVIKAGFELEAIINAHIPKHLITTVDDISRRFIGEDKEIVIKPRKPKAGELAAIESDYAVFFHSKRQFFVIELKDGETFDTQKSPITKAKLQENVEFITHVTGYDGRFFVCSFNADSKIAIVDGFKRVFTQTQVMMGQELCHYLEVDYEQIMAQREADQEENKYYFLGQADKAKTDVEPEDYFEEKRRAEIKQLRLYWE